MGGSPGPSVRYLRRVIFVEGACCLIGLLGLGVVWLPARAGARHAAVRGAACALGPPCRPHARPERHLTRPAVVGFPCRTKGFHGRTKGFHGRTKGRYVPKRPVPRSVQGEERLRCRNSFCQFSRRTCCTTFSPRQSSSSTSSWAGSSGGPRPPKNKMARGRASCPPAIPPGR